jgi:hypothetical protein
MALLMEWDNATLTAAVHALPCSRAAIVQQQLKAFSASYVDAAAAVPQEFLLPLLLGELEDSAFRAARALMGNRAALCAVPTARRRNSSSMQAPGVQQPSHLILAFTASGQIGKWLPLAATCRKGMVSVSANF